MPHDELCPVAIAGGSCCAWMPEPCNCQCVCDFIDEVRADERRKLKIL